MEPLRLWPPPRLRRGASPRLVTVRIQSEKQVFHSCRLFERGLLVQNVPQAEAVQGEAPFGLQSDVAPRPQRLVEAVDFLPIPSRQPVHSVSAANRIRWSRV